LGKEFLIFQILKDDFFSLIVRSCWMVSFFFTPIYTLMLLFFTVFGPKKGVLQTYFLFWNFKHNDNFFFFFTKKNLQINFYKLNSYLRFQYTSITSNLTTLILFTFWIFFFFFGESLLLLLFNFSSIHDAIPGSYFLNFKNFTVFSLLSLSGHLQISLNFFIYFFSLSSLFFLIKLKYHYIYKYICIENKFNFFFFILLFFFL
jgi:hypothetical protein